MADTKIEWVQSADGTKGKTWNPVVGCTWASSGCDNCYAATMSRRLEAMGKPDYVGLTSSKHFNGTVRTLDHRLSDPLRWRKPRVVFVNSMSDLFHKDVPFEFIDKVFAVMALTPQHTYQVLTKRPERMAEYLNRSYMPGAICDAAIRDGRTIVKTEWKEHDRGTYSKLTGPPWPLPNIWLGASIENQQTADKRIPHLLRCPAAVRFLSCEPLLGPVDLTTLRPPACDDLDCLRGGWHTGTHRIYEKAAGSIHWVIVGGESGPKARTCDVAWIRSIVEQCNAAGVACFVKQVGSKPMSFATVDFGPPDNRDYDSATQMYHYRLKDRKGGDPAEWPEDLRVRQMPQETT